MFRLGDLGVGLIPVAGGMGMDREMAEALQRRLGSRGMRTPEFQPAFVNVTLNDDGPAYDPLELSGALADIGAGLYEGQSERFRKFSGGRPLMAELLGTVPLWGVSEGTAEYIDLLTAALDALEADLPQAGTRRTSKSGLKDAVERARAQAELLKARTHENVPDSAAIVCAVRGPKSLVEQFMAKVAPATTADVGVPQFLPVGFKCVSLAMRLEPKGAIEAEANYAALCRLLARLHAELAALCEQDADADDGLYGFDEFEPEDSLEGLPYQDACTALANIVRELQGTPQVAAAALKKIAPLCEDILADIDAEPVAKLNFVKARRVLKDIPDAVAACEKTPKQEPSTEEIITRQVVIVIAGPAAKVAGELTTRMGALSAATQEVSGLELDKDVLGPAMEMLTDATKRRTRIGQQPRPALT